jgi:predicted transcriptional regulator
MVERERERKITYKRHAVTIVTVQTDLLQEYLREKKPIIFTIYKGTISSRLVSLGGAGNR